MNPTNANPNQDQMSTNPAMPSAQPATEPMASAPASPVMPTVQMPMNPEMVVATESMATASPEMNASVVNSVASETVASVVNPMASETVASVVNPTMSEMPTPVNPVITPGVPSVETEGIMVGATDPIAMPNLPKAPDPVEEELKAPMTAAAPVPGSIGSAISVPSDQSTPQTPNNVAFNDPAMMQQTVKPAAASATTGKKSSKTLIMLCIVAGIVVVGLVVVLIMMSQGMI